MKKMDMPSKVLPPHLIFRWSCHSWDIGGYDKTRSEQGELPLRLGPSRFFEGFGELSILEITPLRIVVKDRFRQGEVFPHTPLCFSFEDEGVVDHEGILWGSDEYSLKILWPQEDNSSVGQ